jgi:hypothetical protein
MDERGRGGYLRSVALHRPSRSITLATALASAVCAAAGFFLGSRSDDTVVSDAAPLLPAAAPAAADPIVVPRPIELPKP